METLDFAPRKVLLGVWIAGAVLFGLVIGGGAAAISSAEQADPWIGFFLGASIPSGLIMVYLLLYFPTIRYQVDDSHVTRASGVLWKVRRSVPLEKITNIDVRQGPLERILGFGRIWIFTPSTGAMLPEAVLRGIGDPHGLKQIIIDRAEAAKASPAGPAAPPRAAAIAADDDVVSLLREIAQSLRRIEGKLGSKEE